MTNPYKCEDSVHDRPIKLSKITSNWREYGDVIRTGVENGARFKEVSYTISLIVLTFTVPVIYYIPVGVNPAQITGVPNMVTLVMGWWGFPWGPINSIRSLSGNKGGGKDVTNDVAKRLKLKTKAQIGREGFKELLRNRKMNASASQATE